MTLVGNVVTSPTRKRTQNGSVTNFRVASTERYFDSGRQEWVDGSTFFLDVECWNDLGGNVAHSISKGDPVVVVGSMRTHEWDSDQGRRSRPQMRAEAVALNLARGIAEFRRMPRAAGASAAEEPPAPTEEQFTGSPEDPTDGRDYEVADEAFTSPDADDLQREPAHA